MRQNLDPFDQFDDAALNAALTSAGLFSLQDKNDHGRLTLDSSIASGGGNLSVGQRQIIALARAIVRGSKLLILDEATSAIGPSFPQGREFSLTGLMARPRDGHHYPIFFEERAW